MCIEEGLFREEITRFGERAIQEGILVEGGFLEITGHPEFFISLEGDEKCKDEVGPKLVIIDILETKEGRICVYQNLP